MSMKRSTTIAALAIGAVLLAGGTAHADQRPPAKLTAGKVAPSGKTTVRIGAGSTAPGEGWQTYGDNFGIYLDVDTSSAHFSGTPVYTASVGGNGEHWALQGVNAIYKPTATGFRIYVRWDSTTLLTPATAQKDQWYINWIGVDNP